MTAEERAYVVMREVVNAARNDAPMQAKALLATLTKEIEDAVAAERKRCCEIIESHRMYNGNRVRDVQLMVDKIRGDKP